MNPFITILKAKTATKPQINKGYEILIHAYAVTEIEIWGENYSRISFHDFKQLCSEGSIYFAEMDNEIVGCISINKLSKNRYTFGLLAGDFTKKGQGIGRALIDTAEAIAREEGAGEMHIEVLVPDDSLPPFKKHIISYYEKLGYQKTRKASFLELKPTEIEKNKRLKTPSSFVCMIKKMI